MAVKAAERPGQTEAPRSQDPTFHAFVLLRLGFALAPILFGLDKFLNLTADWTSYLDPGLASLLPGDPQQIMYAVGVVEILAGILVALRPRIGSYVVAGWLGGIIVNLLALGSYYDVALRDFGLLLAALTLSRLAVVHDGGKR